MTNVAHNHPHIDEAVVIDYNSSSLYVIFHAIQPFGISRNEGGKVVSGCSCKGWETEVATTTNLDKGRLGFYP